ncbi:MAG: methionine--tRNA ligase [Rhizobiales bacterium 65-9]|nr:methionine--tRNA ligase [Hyphomicrobiales bacterium]OJY35683.1 MAG: methionine--tRNA ligase [Rhizobiales bacterium 65-9]
MSAREKFYITTAISYPNGAPHVGHAYEVMATDAIARFKRIDGYDVFFLTGTDEHGQKVQRAAANKGVTPKAYVDDLAALFLKMDERLNISFDRFIRTTDADHTPSTQELWRRMEKNGDIYLDRYSGWYSVRDEAYYAEDETSLLADGTRVGGQGTPVEWVEEESFFFRLSAYQDRLLKLYADNPDFISPRERLNEVTSFVRGGLQDLSISRTTFDWGVPVPPGEAKTNQKHIMYVWVDALNNYVTGCGFPDEKNPRWKYWPADAHIIGKDITRFHTVYWPAFLMSAGLPLPKRVFGHGFVLNKGEKMSKSVGNVVDPFSLADHYGVDQVRYFFLREVPFGQDGSYSHEAIVNRINADLANDLGNLAQRSLSMIAKNCEGKLPAMAPLTDADRALLALADALPEKSRAAMKDFAIHAMLAEIWNVVAEANRYFAAQEPWILRKSDPARMGVVLAVTAETLRAIGIAAQPAIPDGARKLLDLLAVPEDKRMLADIGAQGRLAAGTALPAPSGVYPRYVEAEADKT